MLYDAQAPELVAGRFKARRFMNKYNTHFPEDATPVSMVKDREEMLKGIMGSVGKSVFIEPPVNIDYGCNIRIGDNFYSNFNPLVLLEVEPCLLVISLVVLDCGLLRTETEVQSRRDEIEYAKPVVIGDDCWIGGNTTIMPGVTIGKGCTIGAGSIVTKDIPDFSVAIGTPARVVKKVTPVPDL
ncbi:hypothetical protein RRF57_007487 [Xylaria bambusicola]|uniref:Maltose/galactoside acetyltransferase domain-containing protein n=1 Tax=Xylaria bambusicola TaxID=326684 RepID=A0AAN7US32_9PEZI